MARKRLARKRRPRAATKRSPTRDPTTLEPSAALRSPRAPVPSSEATQRRLDELLALVDREGYRHPFLAAESSDGWVRAVDQLLERYRGAADPRDAAKHLGTACRRDPRLLASPIVRDQLLVWRLEVAEGAVRRNLLAARLCADDARAEAQRRETADVARSALRRFGRSLAESPRQTHVAAAVFERVYRDVEERVQQAIAKARFSAWGLQTEQARDLQTEALKSAGLKPCPKNLRALRASQGRGLEIIEREVGSRLGLSRSKVRARRAQLVPDHHGSTGSAFEAVLLRRARRA
jgi:hypothetical protein